MQVRAPSFFSIAIASSRDAFPIHNTHLPGASLENKEPRAPAYSLTRSLTFPSPSAPIRLPRSLRLPTATASSRWRRTPTPCGPRCASRPRSTAVTRRTPWHPRFSPLCRRRRREAGRERDHDAVAPTPAALKTDRAPFTTFQSQAMSNPYGGASQFMYPGYMVRAPAHTPRPFQNAAPWRYLSTGKSQSPTFFLTHCPPSPRSLLRFTSGCVRSRRGR